MWWVILLTVLVVIICRSLFRRHRRFHHIPGPGFWQTLKSLRTNTDPTEFPLASEQLSRQYGPVLHIRTLFEDLVVVSTFDTIHEVLVTKGAAFGGRPDAPHIRWLDRDRGLKGVNPDDKWMVNRKIAHSHIKQFGDGMARIEEIVKEVALGMIEDFLTSDEAPVDPFDTLERSVTASILLVLTGTTQHLASTVTKLFHLQFLIKKYFAFSGSLNTLFFSKFPWLLWMSSKLKRHISDYKSTETSMWNNFVDQSMKTPEIHSLTKLLMEAVQKQETSKYSKNVKLEEIDARRSMADLLLAGVTTTTMVLYNLVNVLAHHPHCQQCIFQEIQALSGGEQIGASLKDKHRMPYTRAALLEVQRYHSLVTIGLAHTSLRDSSIAGYPIYKGTKILTHLWAMQHDPEFWGDPHVFRPERFLDTVGDLVAADHPYRRHVMPFGAGYRVCVGETLATARLFLLTTALLQRFSIRPAPGNTKQTAETSSYTFSSGAAFSPRYKVIFQPRP